MTGAERRCVKPAVCATTRVAFVIRLIALPPINGPNQVLATPETSVIGRSSASILVD